MYVYSSSGPFVLSLYSEQENKAERTNERTKLQTVEQQLLLHETQLKAEKFRKLI